MKNIFKYPVVVTVAILFMATACKKDLIMFDSSMNLVGFSSVTASVKEDLGAQPGVQVYLGAALGTPATTVTITVDTVGLGKIAAKEGIDFTILSKSITAEVGENDVTISPVNNTVFTGDKKFYLVITANSANYKISVQKRVLVTIIDDEHPLKAWIGTYIVAASSYGDTYNGKPEGSWDESWTVVVSAVEGDVTKLSFSGVGAVGSGPIIATLDKNALTISFAKGQNLGDVYGYGDTEVWYGFDDLSLDLNVDVEGTLNVNGAIHIDNWGELVKDPTGDWVWDVFNTTWTKTK
jgi:hypothetical protein